MRKHTFKSAVLMAFIASMAGCGDTSSTSGGGDGSSGSLAAMAVVQGELQVLESDGVRSLDIATAPATPELVTKTYLEGFTRGETLKAYGDDYIFIGTENGVEIKQWQADIEEDAPRFKHIDTVTHFRAFDPVIAHGEFAYFTTRDGREDVNSPSDIVAIVDISDLSGASVIFRYRGLDEPHGLTLFNDSLYVCDKVEGLVKFSIEEVDLSASDQQDAEGNTITEQTFGPGLVRQFVRDTYPCNDIIATSDRLILTSSEGITQLKTKGEGFELLSEIRND